MTTPPTPAELRDLLLAGAANNAGLNDQAAVHLLLYTDLPETPGFLRHVDLDVTWAAGGGSVPVARVRDWGRLIGDRRLRLPEPSTRLLQIAASFSVGRPVDLSAAVTNLLDWAHVTRIVEAVLLASNSGRLLTLAETGELAAQKQRNAALSNG